MSVETAFYIVGLIVMAGALIVSFAGLKLKGFPSRGALTGILAIFLVLVIGTCGLAVAVARKEQDQRRAEQAEAAKLADQSADETTSEAGDDGATAEEQEQPAQSAGGAGGTLTIAADESALAYDKTELETSAGEVTIDFDNPSPIPHDVVVRGQDGNDIGGTDVITQSEASVTLDLEPGDYQFYCSVPGHEEAGMVGTLTVE